LGFFVFFRATRWKHSAHEKMKKRLPPLNVRGKSVILQPQSKKTKKHD